MSYCTFKTAPNPSDPPPVNPHATPADIIQPTNRYISLKTNTQKMKERNGAGAHPTPPGDRLPTRQCTANPQIIQQPFSASSETPKFKSKKQTISGISTPTPPVRFNQKRHLSSCVFFSFLLVARLISAELPTLQDSLYEMLGPPIPIP